MSRHPSAVATLGFGIALLCLGAELAAAGDPSETITELRRRAAGYVAEQLERQRIPGAAVAIVWRGETVLLDGWGLAEVDKNLAIDPEKTIFRVGSVSKALTSTAALGLVREGVLGLHEDLRPRLASLPLRPGWPDPLTLHHLLTHTGGFDEVLFGQHTRQPERWLSLEAFLQRSLPPRFERPGRVIAYNDFQTCLAGLLVERADGGDFAAAATRSVLGPLGMQRSTFRQLDLPSELAGGLAEAYEEVGGALRRIPRDLVLSTPAAGLQTTAADMATYLRAVLGHHPQRRSVLSDELWATQISRQHSQHPTLPGWGYGFAEDHRRGWNVWFKDGQASGFSARLLVVPDLELGVFSVINRSIIRRLGVWDPCVSFHRTLGDHLLDAFAPPAASPPTPPPPPRDAARRRQLYAGVYRYAVASRHTPERVLTWNDDFRVRLDQAGRVLIGGSTFVEVGEGLVRAASGGPATVVFGDAETAGYRYLFFNRSTYERVPWWGWSQWTPWIAATYLLLAVAAAIGGSIAAIAARWRGRSGWLAALLAGDGLLRLVAFASFAAVLGTSDPHGLFSGLPDWLAWASWLPVVALAPAVASGVLALRRRSTPRAVAGLVLLYLVVTFSEIPWLWHWRLLALPLP